MEMDRSWTTIAQTGSIDALYELFQQFPNILEEIDNVSFIDTPAHLAASAAHTHFAIEVLRLKPSFGSTPNPDRFIPLVLALRSERFSTVKKLVIYDPELIRVNGKLGFTPLHYVAEADRYVDLLEEFLSICPKCIEDVTIRRKTAVQIAVKNQNVRALELMLARLKLTKYEMILNRTDDEGNTLLHATSYANNYEAVSLLIKKVDVHAKNLEGLTALDINVRHPNGGDVRIEEILRSTANSKESFKTRLLREYYIIKPVKSIEEVNALLVIDALIVTATYQSLLNPPGGISSGADDNSKSNMTGTEDPAGKAQMGKYVFDFFLFLNSTAFFASTTMIALLLLAYINTGLYMSLSLISLICSYWSSALIISPEIRSPYLLSLSLSMASLAPIATQFVRACYKSRK